MTTVKFGFSVVPGHMFIPVYLIYHKPHLFSPTFLFDTNPWFPDKMKRHFMLM